MTRVSLTLVIIVCSTTCLAQFLEPLFGDSDEGIFDSGGLYSWSIVSMQQMNTLIRRVLALERNLQSGAFGGCESGVIGPFHGNQHMGQINFRGRFLAPPTVSLALSDIHTNDSTTPLSIRVRPSGVNTRGVTVKFADSSQGHGMVSAFVSYMACPSNGNPPVQV